MATTTTTNTNTSSSAAAQSPSSPQLHDLISKHILQIVSSPVADNRRALYPSIYHRNVVVHDTDGTIIRGLDGLDALVERLVGKGGQFEGWEFRIDEKGVKRNGDFVWVGWVFGPLGDGREIDVKVTGADGILLDVNEQGEARIKTIWVIVDGENDVKP